VSSAPAPVESAPVTPYHRLLFLLLGFGAVTAL
jgi:hypothetical protein